MRKSNVSQEDEEEDYDIDVDEKWSGYVWQYTILGPLCD